MEPLHAGLIGAALVLLLVALVIVMRRGHATLKAAAANTAPVASPEVTEILTALTGGVLLVGPHDEILVVNEPGLALGLARGSRVGFPELLQQVRAVRTGQNPFHGVLTRKPPGAEPLELRTLITALDGQLVLVQAEDETSRKRAEAVGRDFIANVSHELKTPIGAMQVLAEAVEAAAGDADAVAGFAARLQHEATRLAQLVNQLIELSRLQSANPQLRYERVAVVDFVQEAVSRSAEQAEQRHVALIVAPGASAEVWGDSWQLADAVTNLVQNAINYSGEHARVVISVAKVAADGDQFVDIAISDNGIGIKAEDQERIFERFYRVDYGRSRATGGTGLGLPIVRQIATVHGGSVRVWSSPGQGSTFTLRLPAHLGPGEEGTR